MIKKPLVSIITPCYNSEKYIDRFLKSLLEQTYDKIQLIIVNDGSTDNTMNIVNRYIEIYNQRGFILTIINQENQGLGGAINTGLKHVKGEYFAWCDSDNFYTNDYIEEKVNFFRNNPQFSIVRCDGYIVKSDNLNKILGNMAHSKNDRTEQHMFLNCLYVQDFHFGCAMIRTKDFDLINPKREIYKSREGQNWQLLLPMFYHYLSGYIDKPMFYFVYRADSISNITKMFGIEKRIEQIEEYERIIINTLKTIKMDAEEYEKYVYNIHNKYLIDKFFIAIRYKNCDYIERYYKILQQEHLVDSKIRIKYLRAKNKFIDFIFKIANLPIRVFKKIIRLINK